MPVSLTLMGNRFHGNQAAAAAAAAAPESTSSSFGDVMWSFLSTMFPHLLSIGIGIFLIYLNKMVNDRHKEEQAAAAPVTTKSRSIAKPEPELQPATEQIPMAPAPVLKTEEPPAPKEAPAPAPKEEAPKPVEPAPAPVEEKKEPAPAPVEEKKEPAPAPVEEKKEPAPAPVEEKKEPAPAPVEEKKEPEIKEKIVYVEKIVEKIVEVPVEKPAPAPEPVEEEPEEEEESVEEEEEPEPEPEPVKKAAPKKAAPKKASPKKKAAALPPAPVDLISVTRSENSSETQQSSPCLKKLLDAYPKALPNEELISKVADALEEYGYGETTLLATSLCCDEVNRVLDEQFHKVYEHHFSMGGLAGFPFGGVTSFGAMAHHIPDGGSCLIVYGPHVGIDSTGKVGMIDRRGRKNNGACCGSAADAANHVAEVRGSGPKSKRCAPVRPLDAQQAFVRSMLMPYGKRLEISSDAKVELPFALYDAMDDMMRQIVTFGSGEVAGEGKIALLGGIQINTPEEHSDYFLPLTFEIRDNHNLLIDNLMWW